MVQVCASGDLKGELIRAKRAPPGPGSTFRSVVARERGHDAEAVKEYARRLRSLRSIPTTVELRELGHTSQAVAVLSTVAAALASCVAGR